MTYFKPRRFPREGNPYWPLPPDYPSLSTKGRSRARVNALLQQDTPDDLVAAWDLFRNHYLVPTPVGQWYQHGFSPSPAYHYQWIRDLGSYPYNAWAAPRSAAKSTVIAGEIPLLFLLTRPNFETVIFFSAGKFVKTRFDKFQVQLETNERILEDFGDLKPPRGKGLWNHSELKLRNGAACYGLPVEGRMLGLRPGLLQFDDVEFDPSLQSAPTIKTSAFENLMVNTALPMMERGTCLCVIGTLHRRSFYIYYLCTTRDPKYSRWNRRVLGVYDTKGKLTWGEKLSEEFLAEKRALMGEAAFRANYLNEPGTDSDRLLTLHPDLGYYDVDQEDGETLTSSARLISGIRVGTSNDGVPRTDKINRPFGEVVSKMFRIMCVDYAPTVSQHSDYSCAMVMGFENSEHYKDVLWVLDMFHGKVKSDVLIRKIWEMSSKWRVHAIGVEAVSVQKELADRVATDIAEFGSILGSHVPRVIPIKLPAGLSKPDRICGLQWRFNQYRIRLPRNRMNEQPWSTLFSQIESFTEDLALLKNDDAIDTLAMNQYIVRPRSTASSAWEQRETSVSEYDMLMKDGSLFNAQGQPIVSSLGSAGITPEVLQKLRELKYGEDADKPRRGRWVTT